MTAATPTDGAPELSGPPGPNRDPGAPLDDLAPEVRDQIERLAARLSRILPVDTGRIADVLAQLDDLDKGVYEAVAASPTPSLDRLMRQISDIANFSKLWIGIAALLAAVGGRRGRRAALDGLIAIAVTSTVVNQGAKRVVERGRPARHLFVPAHRHVKMPDSTSFPSGHSASAFAFATAVGAQVPLLAFPLTFLAGVVAYSRVHTGVHYPVDVVVGTMIGSASGEVVSWVALRRAGRRGR